jgi:protein TonB
VSAASSLALGIALAAAVATHGLMTDQSRNASRQSAAQSNAAHQDPSPTDAPPDFGTGHVPGGVPDGQSGHAIDWIISSAPVVKPRVATPLRIRVSAGVSQKLLVKRVDPEYPIAALRGRIRGNVVLHILITKAGDVATVELVLGHPILAAAATDAVKQWKYKPYLLNGIPIEVDTEVLVSFSELGT